MIPQADESLTSEVLTPEEVIQLLEERLVVRSDKRKVGEIVVRKEIETRIVEVPVRREKLIVERVDPTYERIAEIDLGQSQINGKEHTNGTAIANGNTIQGEFDSPKTVSDLLDAIARTPDHNCAEIRIEITLKDSKHKETYQAWFDRCRKS
ncbi:DUF2382 domain-containing protein [Cyanobacteria bacterium FACHB-DQ100]|uniref:DUF2382 domain-containing protein n=1 Tax=unclassified Leptolyngbya TaxID=2650499 RepID=UPI00168153BF|nr:DUF2382 domain-containing protein [Leptolyngbya sp. FACHB-17]MBD1822425.1 DUF2382 domain-containing protein [Cyanobacteria bacterium FACHB-DQ100]MBD2081069.1 DUF2382 domain-containing protein [Leptolyngbya sp. FACHB-17]